MTTAISITPDMLGLQTTGSKRPFFFLHGDYKGGAFYCYQLAHALGVDQPFYALEPCRLDDLQALRGIEDMAALHIQLLRAVQPEGPYLLGGFCNGALVAYEMARQLQHAGQRVDLLLLMDPVPVAHLRWLRRAVQFFGAVVGLQQRQRIYSFLWLQHAFNYIQHIYRCLFNAYYGELHYDLDDEQIRQDGGMLQALKSLYELQLGQGYAVTHTCTRRTRRVHWHEIFPDALFPALDALIHDWGHVFYWQCAEYVPSMYNGKSTFIFFRDSKGYHRRRRWFKLAKALDRDVEVQILPGSEGTWKTVHLHDLSTYIRTLIERSCRDNGSN